MTLPDTVTVKLGVYTLFCRQLLTHLPALNDATRADLRLTCEECCQRFDEELRKFFREADAPDLRQAAAKLGEALLGRVGYFRDQNPQAADVFHQVIEAALAAAPTWCYQDDLEVFHQQGGELARRFYAGSPWPVTQACLDREVPLMSLYEEKVATLAEETFGYCSTLVAFKEDYWQEETDQKFDAILVCFAFDRDFALYLAYPFLFMHEYVSHIFVWDQGNERFNDGWLLYAAYAFLADQIRNLDYPLLWEQLDAFGVHLCGKLRPIPRRTYFFVQHFNEWLGDPGHFQAMTWELAAFEPRVGESPFWPDQFINRLAQEFDHNRPLLRRKIETAHDLRTLFEMLPPA